mmetsp:Transcript_8878/g.21961  ORF Transcript_8878/g.21961 Transcript_8878/m.21961 type:complete len:353 (+) Transcript_8878:1339-2397(+)
MPARSAVQVGAASGLLRRRHRPPPHALLAARPRALSHSSQRAAPPPREMRHLPPRRGARRASPSKAARLRPLQLDAARRRRARAHTSPPRRGPPQLPRNAATRRAGATRHAQPRRRLPAHAAAHVARVGRAAASSGRGRTGPARRAAPPREARRAARGAGVQGRGVRQQPAAYGGRAERAALVGHGGRCGSALLSLLRRLAASYAFGCLCGDGGRGVGSCVRVRRAGGAFRARKEPQKAVCVRAIRRPIRSARGTCVKSKERGASAKPLNDLHVAATLYSGRESPAFAGGPRSRSNSQHIESRWSIAHFQTAAPPTAVEQHAKAERPTVASLVGSSNKWNNFAWREQKVLGA